MAKPSNVRPFGKVELLNRIEPRPRTTDFQESLRAEIADPLWMITRQWQFGELKGEDTGVAIHAELSWVEEPIQQIHGKDGIANPNYQVGMPMEPYVEAQSMSIDVKTKARLASLWESLAIGNPKINGQAYYDQTRLLYPFATLPPNPSISDADWFANPEMLEFALAAEQEMPDGWAFYMAIKAAGASGASNLLCQRGTNVAEMAEIDALGKAFIELVEGMGIVPAKDYWQQPRLEYAFDAVANEGLTGTTVLAADKYDSEHLDWYSFDFDKNPNHPARKKTKRAGIQTVKTSSVIPSKVQYAGMPSSRWWEFEHGDVNLGKMEADKTDIAQILLAEFSLMYSNDWMALPISLPYGTICEIREIIVMDSFGVKTKIPAASANISDNTWAKWGMFNLNTKDNVTADQITDTRLVIPNVPAGKLSSPAVEKVLFVRDETSNLVWGIEESIQDGLGGSMDGVIAAKNIAEFFKRVVPAPLVTEDNIRVETNSEFTFKLIDSANLPENRIPFKSETHQGLLMLRRGKRRRMVNQTSAGDVMATTQLLRPEGSGHETPFRIFSNEVPKEGLILQSNWQRCRTPSGGIMVWKGNELRVGSPNIPDVGLRFDVLEKG